jgi:hypothetical protein
MYIQKKKSLSLNAFTIAQVLYNWRLELVDSDSTKNKRALGSCTIQSQRILLFVSFVEK